MGDEKPDNLRNDPSPEPKARGMSRRGLLKGAATASPMVLSLGSGSALARSSNLIGEAKYGAVDGKGRTYCLDTRFVYEVAESDGVYDLGPQPAGVVHRIRDRDHYTATRRRYRYRVSEREMCKQGGVFHYNEGYGWREVNVPRGIVVSSQAVGSFAPHITFIDV